MVLTRKSIRFILFLTLVAVVAWTANVEACDPNMVPEMILHASEVYSSVIGVFPLLLEIFNQTGSFIPAKIDPITSYGSHELSPGIFYSGLIFKSLLAVSSATNLTDAGMRGRFSLNIGPTTFTWIRNRLIDGPLQFSMLQITLPASARVCYYRPDGGIEYIDEVNSDLQAMIVSAWPPVRFDHLKLWNNHRTFIDWSPKGEHQEWPILPD